MEEQKKLEEQKKRDIRLYLDADMYAFIDAEAKRYGISWASYVTFLVAERMASGGGGLVLTPSAPAQPAPRPPAPEPVSGNASIVDADLEGAF